MSVAAVHPRRPERWDIPEAATPIPSSVWANLLTFFAGPTNCIGFHFALTEMKALLFILIRAFEFEAAVVKNGIGLTFAFFQVPVVLAEQVETFLSF
ncbi:hypothetical protein C8R44DRAFT_876986 [Mycena epipterygia]|nr:hypothetical protein C8R44DRAFT_876986 [Mycena epipterygia]